MPRNGCHAWIAAMLLYGAASNAAGERFDLLSADEAAQWNAVNAHDPGAFAGLRDLPAPVSGPSCHDGKKTDSAGSPQIKILAPRVEGPLSAPLDINLEFVPAAGAVIRPDTFRVCYVGFVTVDITKRITERVPISAQGLHVAGAQLPAGHHHLVMLIADDRGNTGRSEAQLDIR